MLTRRTRRWLQNLGLALGLVPVQVQVQVLILVPVEVLILVLGWARRPAQLQAPPPVQKQVQKPAPPRVPRRSPAAGLAGRSRLLPHDPPWFAPAPILSRPARSPSAMKPAAPMPAQSPPTGARRCRSWLVDRFVGWTFTDLPAFFCQHPSSAHPAACAARPMGCWLPDRPGGPANDPARGP